MPTSSSALADALEDEETTPGGEGRKGGGHHEEIFTVTVPSMVTVLLTDELILANRAELLRWDAYHNQLYSILYLSTKGEANSFLVRFVGRPNSRQQPDGQAAWKATGKKYLISPEQRRRMLMRKLNGMAMRPNQNSDRYLTDIFQQPDELEHIDESFAEACILDLILEGLSDEYEPIRSAAEWDPEISMKKNEITM